MSARAVEWEEVESGSGFGAWEWIGAALALGLFAAALSSRGFAVDDAARAWAFAACGAFGAWGGLSLAMGRWRLAWGSPSAWALAGAGALCAWAGLMLVPLPTGLVESISPAWAGALGDMRAVGFEPPRRVPLALSPDKAWAGLLQALATTGFLAGALALASRRRGALLLMAGLAIFSLAQGWLGALLSAVEGIGRSPGIFFNPNHHAASTIAGLPVAAAWFLWMRERGRDDMAGGAGDKTLFLFGVLLVAAAGWLASLSRGSLLLAGPVVLAWAAWEAYGRLAAPSWTMAGRGSARGGRVGWTGVVLFAAAFVVVVAMSPMLGAAVDRIEPGAAVGRIGFWKASLAGLWETRGMGVGLGGAEYSISRFLEGQPARKVAIFSHNDWVQGLVELGLAGAAIALCIGALHAAALRRAWAAELRSAGWEALAVRRAALAGLAALLAHAFVEFHLRMPAIGLQAAALLALLSERGPRLLAADD